MNQRVAPRTPRAGRLTIWLLLAGWSLVIVSSTAQATTPWQKMTLFKHIEADPNTDYLLTEDQGPWMVMAVTFCGVEAERQSKELVQELRSFYKMPAYRYKMEFDYQQGTVGRGIDRFGAPRKMKYRTDKSSEIAVLVGDFATHDDPTIQKILKRLRYAQPDCLDDQKLAKEGRSAAAALAGWRSAVEAALNPDESKRRGPMGRAFVTSNPLLPDEYYRPRGLDKLVVAMNKPLKYSLLNCPGKFSVKVATFSGRMILDQEEIKAVEAGKKMQGQLEIAEVRAHELCEALRAKGYEAYEFHDRASSIVTIGSFPAVGVTRADGGQEIDPQIRLIMDTFGPEKVNVPGVAAPQIGKPKVVGVIPLDLQPMPYEVPKLGLDVTAERSMLGRF